MWPTPAGWKLILFQQGWILPSDLSSLPSIPILSHSTSDTARSLQSESSTTLLWEFHNLQRWIPPCACHEGIWKSGEGIVLCILKLQHEMELRSQLHTLATLTLVNEHVVPNRRPDGPQSQSEHFEEESPCSWPKLDDDSSVIQTVAQSL